MPASRVLNATPSAAGTTEPVVGATVSLVDTGRSTRSDGDGCFRLEEVRLGAQVLSVNSTSTDTAGR